MGVEICHVVSDERHYGSFLCTICQNISGLDALVTSKCSHVFCRQCLETWLLHVQLQNTPERRCPTCNRDLLFHGGKNATMMIGNNSIDVRPLVEAQPLAHRVLTRLRVACPLRSKHGCTWEGDYGDLQDHLTSATAHQAMDVEENKPKRNVTSLAESFKEEANTMFSSGHFREARDLYGKGISIFANSDSSSSADKTLLAALYANRAATHLQLKDFEACATDCDAAIQLDETYVKAYIRKSKALMELGRFEGAESLLKQGCEQNLKSKNLENELRRVSAIHTKMTLGMDFLRAKDFASAKAEFGGLLRDTSAARVVLAAARADLGLGLTDGALRLSLQVIRTDNKNAEGYEVRGHCMFLMGDFENALPLIREALRLDPDCDGAKVIMKKTKNVYSAVKEARKAVFHRGFDQAVDFFTCAIESSSPLPMKAPLYSILYSERAEAYLRLKKYESTLKDCAQAIYARDDCVKAWLIKMKAYHALERHADARNELAELMHKWGSGNDQLRKAYERADFELRKQRRPDFYALLGVSPIASLVEIKKQYKVKAMEYHPDRYASEKYTNEQRKGAEEKFKLMGEGLEILSNDVKRQLYDEGYDQEAIRERAAAAEQAAHRSPHHFHGHHR